MQIKQVYHPTEPLVLLNYSTPNKPPHEWTWWERMCRGLILNTETGETVARPFDKFFNWGQVTPSKNEYLIEATTKYDGSLGILYRIGDKFHIATRGSFTSPQALWATEYLQRYDLSRIHPQSTLLFEIIYPENRVVVDYGQQEDLILVGVRDRFWGNDYLASYVIRIAHDYGFTAFDLFNKTSIDAVMEATFNLDGKAQEGYVLRFSDGKRYKLKSPEYLKLHKVVANMTYKRVLKIIMADKDTTPYEDYPEFVEFNKLIKDSVENHRLFIEFEFERVPKNSRKEFALWIQENCLEEYHPYLFARFDGRDCTPLIYRRLWNVS